MNIRPLNLENDIDQMVKIWQEVGWLSSEEKPVLKILFQAGQGYGADLEDELEATLLSLPADINYEVNLLPVQALSGLVVSPRARRQRIGRNIMIRALEEAARSGQALSALIMFEQGFYDRLGFGLGGYKRVFTFDPEKLNIAEDPVMPARLSIDEWKSVHQALKRRDRSHGGISIKSPEFIKAELEWDKNESYGLGYYDDDGSISHFLWLWRQGDSHGPLLVKFLACRNQAQLLDLLAIISRLGDQIHAVKMSEPYCLRLRDFISYPHKQERKTTGGKLSYKSRVEAPGQLKILDLRRCIEALAIPGAELEFNLKLEDPLSKFAGEDSPAVISGEFSLKLGEESQLKEGTVQGLPTLQSSINAFTRLWLGSASPLELKASSQFSAPSELFRKLEETFRWLPEPQFEMYF